MKNKITLGIICDTVWRTWITSIVVLLAVGLLETWGVHTNKYTIICILLFWNLLALARPLTAKE